MPEKIPIDILSFGGIDARHTRKLGQPSAGQNFWTRDGKLFTRDGCTAVTSSFSNPIISIHSAFLVTKDTRLLVQEGTALHHRLSDGGAWAALVASGLNAAAFGSTVWNGLLILGNGTNHKAYNISAGTLADISGTDSIPASKKFATWKGRIWAWNPDAADSDLISFNGYDTNGDLTAHEWPPDFRLRVSAEAGTPLLEAFPFQTHLFYLTQRRFGRIYGDTENSPFSPQEGGVASLVKNCAASCGTSVIWLGLESGVRKIYAYTGTTPTVISQPVDEILQGLTITNAFATNFAGQFWLVCPGASTTTALVFDTAEGQWYKHVFPFVIKAACSFGAYLAQEYLHFGLGNNTLCRVYGTTDLGTEITTEFTLGPFNLENRTVKVKGVWFQVDAKASNAMNVYGRADEASEEGPKALSFTNAYVSSKKASFSGIKGRNISIRVNTTTAINELQSGTVIALPKAVK